MLNISFTAPERFLCEVLVHRDYLDIGLLEQIYRDLGDEAAYALCERNNIASTAADALRRCPGLALPVRWGAAFVVVEERIAGYLREMDRIAALLQSHGIPLVALKNSGIARALYCHPGASPMGDIDVLVRRTDFRRAHEVLVADGFEMKFRSPLEAENLDLAEQSGGAEYSVTLPDGGHLWFELQWRPVAGRWIRREQEPSADALMERSLPIEGSAARLLCPEDNLLQVVLHTAKHTYVRAPGFRLHTDVDRIVRASAIDWERFAATTESLQVKTAVFFSLALAHDLLHTPIPPEVLVRFAPARWKIRLMTHWLVHVGLFDPDARKWGRISYVAFVALLYDDVSGLLRNAFPSRRSMQDAYGIMNPLALGALYIRRLAQMLLRRTLSR